MRLLRYLSTILLALGLPAAHASAQTTLTPFFGVTYGGDTLENRYVYGGLLSFGETVGLDVDFGFAPNFFGDADPFLEFQSKLNITTLMANLRIGGSPQGAGISPFISGGVGLMRASISTTGDLFDELSRNDFALNAGAGLVGYFSQHVGLRGDVRYFRSLADSGDDGFIFDPRNFDLGDFDYWRATVGVSFRF
jgi:opacity protein-like surface antigen